MLGGKLKDLKGPSLSLIKRWASLSEYTEKPEYPPILDLSRDAVKMRENEKYYEEIKAIPTVEEKLMKINMPKYYGWRCIGLYEDQVPYGSLQFAQYATRTYHKNLELPEVYKNSNMISETEQIVEQIRDDVKEAIVLEHSAERCLIEENENLELGDRIMQQINGVILNYLMNNYPHLLNSQVQHYPRLESFWIVGGVDPPKQLEKIWEKVNKQKLGKPVDVKLQYFGLPIIQLRNKFPLLPIVDRDESQNYTKDVPIFKYDPRVLRLTTIHRHVTNIPGFWPGDESEYPLLSFHSTKHLSNRRYNDEANALSVQAILASYAWLQAVSTYQGFTTYYDVTYPLVTQTVLSDGQYWSFYVYQLNTTLLHSHHCDSNSLCNLCWGTNKLQLYEEVENGSVVGFNDEVLKTLLSFYLNVPQLREGIEMKPYLGSDVKYVANISQEEKRVWLEKRFKYMYSNRGRHLLPYELYHWEKIYKVDNKTRPYDARRRPFELGENPYSRRYDDHVRQYIPKAQRKTKKDKWEKTYYP